MVGYVLISLQDINSLGNNLKKSFQINGLRKQKQMNMSDICGKSMMNSRKPKENSIELPERDEEIFKPRNHNQALLKEVRSLEEEKKRCQSRAEFKTLAE